MMGSPPVVRLLAAADLKKTCISSLGLSQSHEPLKSAWGHQVRDVKHEKEILSQLLKMEGRGGEGALLCKRSTFKGSDSKLGSHPHCKSP